MLKLFTPKEHKWLSLENLPVSENTEQNQKEQDIESNKSVLREMLLSALQMPNLVVLSGSGTSRGNAGGPAMWNLWDYAVNKNAGAPDEDPRIQTTEAQAVIQKIKFDVNQEKKILKLYYHVAKHGYKLIMTMKT